MLMPMRRPRRIIIFAGLRAYVHGRRSVGLCSDLSGQLRVRFLDSRGPLQRFSGFKRPRRTLAGFRQRNGAVPVSGTVPGSRYLVPLATGGSQAIHRETD